MARAEYIKFSEDEKVFGVKNLLQGQVSMLNIIKHFNRFREIRKEEMTLRIALKSKLAESLTLLNSIVSEMPKVKMNETEEQVFDKEKIEKKQVMENELEEIRRKLESLR